MPSERESLVTNYLRYLRSHCIHDPSFSDEDELAAWEGVAGCVTQNPELAWLVLLEVLSRCEPAERSIVGSGALEDFFFENVSAFGERIEEQLRTNAAFLEAFQFVYMGGVPERLWRHFNGVLAALGVPENELREWSWVDTERYPNG